jgi:hypothetical protein
VSSIPPINQNLKKYGGDLPFNYTPFFINCCTEYGTKGMIFGFSGAKCIFFDIFYKN